MFISNLLNIVQRSIVGKPIKDVGSLFSTDSNRLIPSPSTLKLPAQSRESSNDRYDRICASLRGLNLTVVVFTQEY